MAALTPSNVPYRHVVGDLVTRFYQLSGNNGDTLTIPGMGPILLADATPTTAISMGVIIANNVITFVSAGAWAAVVQVMARYG
jgi:hypothetical protein